MAYFDEAAARNDLILKLMEHILNLSDDQRLNLLHKLEEIPLETFSLGERDVARKPYDQTISFYVKNRRYQAVCKDISTGGVFIQTNEIFRVGQIVTLDIPFSDGEQTIQVPAEIVRVDSDGIGLRFIKKEKVTYV
ncbi:MAG: PilZ domain-containing protein [Deltaproteobacteria bacterium]|jgi:Tfp pilus assembly protein PilZ